MPEGFTLSSGTAATALPLGGRRRSHKKLRVVKKKTVRRMLKKMGLKMRGGVAGEVTADKVVDDKAATGAVVPTGGRRRHTKKTHRRHRRSLFGLKY
jgi:hypothetical protein